MQQTDNCNDLNEISNGIKYDNSLLKIMDLMKLKYRKTLITFNEINLLH